MTEKLQQLIREADTLSDDEQKLLAHLAAQRNGNGSPHTTAGATSAAVPRS